MKILIYATAAEIGGSISILNYYYNSYINQNHEVSFIISGNFLQSDKNVEIMTFPKIKKSWIYRIYFYWFKLPFIIKSIDPDKIISLNNVALFFTNRYQVLYIQQALPFSLYKTNILQNPYLWFIKNVMGFVIIKSMFRVDKIITQSKWLKDLILEKYKIDQDKIVINQPDSDIHKSIEIEKPSFYTDNKVTFFYPSGFLAYKRHDTVIKALRELSNNYLKKIEVIFTISHLNKRINSLSSKFNDNVIKTPGIINKSQLAFLYQNAVMVFPSEVESFGLPLLEAKSFKTVIFAKKTPFALEILENYDKVFYFEDEKELALLIRRYLDEKNR